MLFKMFEIEIKTICVKDFCVFIINVIIKNVLDQFDRISTKGSKE